MKKTITLLCAFVLAFSFNSCSSDDSSDNANADKIVGSWKLVGDMYFGEFEPYDGETCDLDYLKFSSNGTGRLTEKYCGESDGIYPFTWEKTTDPVFNYITTDEESGVSDPGIVVFSSDFKRFTVYETEEDMLTETYGVVFQRQ